MSDDRERYRIYMRRNEEIYVLATAPDAAGVGQAIITNHEDLKGVGLRLPDLGVLGILDSVAHEWIVLPWQRGEAAWRATRTPEAPSVTPTGSPRETGNEDVATPTEGERGG